MLNKKLSVGVFLILFLLIVPSFWQMLRPGLFSMHDFYPFRLFEFNQCIMDGIFPCRWSQNAGWGYGEPVFNFYPQLTFLIGEVFVVLGLSIVNTTKLVMILSLLASGMAMFLLAKLMWKSNWAGLISAVIYVYAPYRAVDIWVRGAVPEAWAFVFFPLIILGFELFVTSKKNLWLMLFSLSLAGLALTHSVSLLVFLPFFIVWSLYRLQSDKNWHLVPSLILGGLLAIGIASYQLIPILLETKYTNLGNTTQGYFDYQNHFVTPFQLFISKFWGYGNSVMGSNDGMSFSIGHFQWGLALIALICAKITKSVELKKLLILLTVALFSIFMMTEQSTFLWALVSPLSQLQFPWRFLSILVFTLSLISGYLGTVRQKSLVLIFIVGVVIWNFNFFKEEKWYLLSDEEQFIGGRFDEQRAAALQDFWPSYGLKMPSKVAESGPVALMGQVSITRYISHSHSAEIKLEVSDEHSQVQLPIVYFPGWEVKNLLTNKPIPLNFEPELGRITFVVDKGIHSLLLELKDTAPRLIGNIVSIASLLAIGILSLLSLVKIK